MAVRIDKRGTRNHNAKLDLAKVRRILGSAESNAQLARALGVSPATVSNVRTGRTWAWIDEDWDT
jgi:transcriptional regulator with XRE-family HTH domain